ncbi:type II secretion system protein N [Psychrobacter pygoscelis]|uniref:type II secretion system protein N n=1 Tax=Psychrobacter pygoscelis TaxID=2488563 RepID=UPI00103D4364|nr:type II secretion system protein N [Psychrobacter pygoscelis]
MTIAIAPRLKPIVGWLNRLSGWLLLLTIGWLCWAIARLLWLLLAPPQAPILPIAPLQATSSPVDYASSFMIFEQPAPVAPVAKPPPNVSLKGVMLASPESNSAAMLDVNGSVKNYRIGSMLDDSDYKLIAVSWNEVILEDSSAQQVVITLTEPLALDQGQVAAKTPAGQISNQRLSIDDEPLMSQPLEEAQPSETLESAQPIAEGNSENANPQSAITEAVEALQQNPASYLSRMGVMATGEGYQVTDAMPANIKNRLGLEPGDKVLSVNGQSVGSNPGQDAALLNQIKQSGEAQIAVQRGDQVITIRQQF